MGTEKKAAGQARKLPVQGLVNALTRAALSTPGVAKGIGRDLILLYVFGRKSGKRYAIPIAYMEHDGKVLIGTQFGWVRNLRTGDPIQVRYKGRLRSAEVEVVTDADRVAELYTVMCRDNHAFAKFHTIGFDAAGEPDPDAVREAVRLGARAILLTPQVG
ncbi:nitroreductase family deazaflavin-dependent oxidoreductase [Catenulispora sp. NF23]|uniref:Nitroreductase family deazaflavin-dependent oxidoreductase n=1 Tax=Catenulispora pinistramenti TaxID=2705254 RepID=A0ABS5KQA2_9ACTN|nr:nitroreductase/quinone reductase family protein [Catenulispora pinistramenti]MBS2533194.1 nitroreductase family deazaflavin-dependent oxidoreductase [Catenulispora pinistramenti]MBS2548213.1 nitroreductase family deazaflavin-dependent oxidoreductase [Catenulispora pinistramenti]